MKKFRYAAAAVLVFLAAGCKNSINLKPEEIKYDREVCERCTMQVSDKFHSAQVVNPKTGEHFFFDDLGCALLWLEEKMFTWKDSAVIYFTDAISGKWLDGKKAVLAHPFTTPMSFRVGAFSDKSAVPEGKEILTYEQAKQLFLDIKNERMMKKSGGMEMK